MNFRIYIIMFSICLLNVGCALSSMTVDFKDGRKMTGFGEITSDDHIKFKTEDSKTQKYHFNDLERVKIHIGESTDNYVYLKVENEDINVVLREVVAGKVSLYEKVSEGYAPIVTQSGGPGGGTVIMSSGYHFSISNYYVRKENETKVTHLGSTSLFSKNFRKAASEYFEDCPDLLTKIDNDELRKKDIKEIVEFYNLKCK